MCFWYGTFFGGSLCDKPLPQAPGRRPWALLMRIAIAAVFASHAMLAICDRPRARRVDLSHPVFGPQLLYILLRIKPAGAHALTRGLRTLAWEALHQWWQSVVPYYYRTLRDRSGSWRGSELRSRQRRQARGRARFLCAAWARMVLELLA